MSEVFRHHELVDQMKHMFHFLCTTLCSAFIILSKVEVLKINYLMLFFYM